MKEDEERWILGFVGHDLDKKWESYGRKKIWEWGFREKDEVVVLWILKFVFISSRDAL